MKIEGAIFDLDGTLLDSMYIWDTIGTDYLISRGIIPEAGLNEKFKKMSIIQAAQYYQNTYHITDSIDSIISGVNGMIEHIYASEVKIKSGVQTLLDKMAENNIKMCVATATDRYITESALKNNGIDKYFSKIFTCTEVGFGKDSPEIFEKSLEALGTSKSKTVVFEDALHAIETAKSAGFYVIGVYDKSSENESEKIINLCDDYIASYRDWSDKNL